MAVTLLNKKMNDILYGRYIQTQPSLMIKYINHETRIVYVGNQNLFFLPEETDDVTEEPIGWRCRIPIFEKAYPEKWQEIQADLALQKLKES